jgi:hypothetical protein
VRGQFPISRPTRGLLVTLVALVVVAAGCGGSSGGPTTQGPKFTEAHFPGFRLAFSYPSDWKYKGWCWLGTTEYPLALVSTARRPGCSQGNFYGFKTPLPPPLRLGPNDLAAWWAAFPHKSLDGAANTRVAGKPARIVVREEPTKRTSKSYVNCLGSGPKQRRLIAQVRGPGTGTERVQLGAVICGPNFDAGEAAVRKMLNSLRFHR